MVRDGFQTQTGIPTISIDALNDAKRRESEGGKNVKERKKNVEE